MVELTKANKFSKKAYVKTEYPNRNFNCDHTIWKRSMILSKGDQSVSSILVQALKDYNERRTQELVKQLLHARKFGINKDIMAIELQLHRAGINPPDPEVAIAPATTTPKEFTKIQFIGGKRYTV